MADARNRSISLPVDPLEHFKARAEKAGVSVSAWLVEAGRRQLHRELAAETVEFCQRPEIAEQIAEWTAYADQQNAEWTAELQGRAA